ncbi:hypothetical protein ACFFOU_26145 [Pseudonocardia sulfidoxydans]|uniref:hypothetical protein n=1 Tax=Pseudonocardia sulfidoxydans TaxID=54011 RepID=UPI0011BE150D|nr:hypothetical protein [Pseudonocardia sulfidoxydans]
MFQHLPEQWTAYLALHDQERRSMRIVRSALLHALIDPWLRCLAEQDAAALNRGWTVDCGRFGSRIYRDPRWDDVEQLRASHLCEDSDTSEHSTATTALNDPATSSRGRATPRDARVIGHQAVTR